MFPLSFMVGDKGNIYFIIKNIILFQRLLRLLYLLTSLIKEL